MRAGRAWGVALALAWPLAAGAAPTSPATIDDLMHRSGLWSQLASIGSLFQQGVDQGLAQKPLADERMAASMRAAFASAYGVDRLRPAVARALGETLSAEDADAALAWLSTDLGTRITKLEEASSGQSAPDRAAEIGAALPPERRAQYARLSRALHAGEVGATVLINMAWGLAHGIEAATPGGGTTNAEVLRAALQERRPQIVAQLEIRLIGANAVTYAPLGDDELDRYIAFAESPAGGRYHAATSIALERALSDASIEAGRILATSRTT